MPSTTSKDNLTSLSLSSLGLGCGVFGGAYGPESQEEAIGAVRKAFSSGINWVDTSPYYNDSEIKLGKALFKLREEFPRPSYHICTKLGRYGYHTKDFDYSAKRVASSIQESLRRLNTDYLDIVLCHDVEFVDCSQVTDEALPKLFELKSQGVINNVGISGYPLEVLLHIAQIQNERGSPLDVVLSYSHYNLHCQKLAHFVQEFRAAGVETIISASPLSMGLLRSDGAQSWHPAKPELKDAVAKCASIVETQSDMKFAEMAEIYSFSYDGVDSHLVGAKTEQEIAEALEYYKKAQSFKANNRSFEDSIIQRLFEQVRSLLEPFSDYTWPSPPADA